MSTRLTWLQEAEQGHSLSSRRALPAIHRSSLQDGPRILSTRNQNSLLYKALLQTDLARRFDFHSCAFEAPAASTLLRLLNAKCATSEKKRVKGPLMCSLCRRLSSEAGALTSASSGHLHAPFLLSFANWLGSGSSPGHTGHESGKLGAWGTWMSLDLTVLLLSSRPWGHCWVTLKDFPRQLGLRSTSIGESWGVTLLCTSSREAQICPSLSEENEMK